MPEGLMSRAQNVQEVPEQMPDVAADTADQEESVTQEEQQAYDSAMAMVSQLLYKDDATSEKLLKMVKPEDPATGIADASAFLLSKIEETFQGEYPEDLVVSTADEITDLVMELAETAGVEITEDIAVRAKGQLTKQLVEAYGIDPAEFEAASQNVTEEDVAEYSQMFGE